MGGKKNLWIACRLILYFLTISHFLLSLVTISHQEAAFRIWILPLVFGAWDEGERRSLSIFFSFFFFFLPFHSTPDIQRGANRGASSVFMELDITPRQWKELHYLIAGEEPLGALTVMGPGRKAWVTQPRLLPLSSPHHTDLSHTDRLPS